MKIIPTYRIIIESGTETATLQMVLSEKLNKAVKDGWEVDKNGVNFSREHLQITIVILLIRWDQ